MFNPILRQLTMNRA